MPEEVRKLYDIDLESRPYEKQEIQAEVNFKKIKVKKGYD